MKLKEILNENNLVFITGGMSTSTLIYLQGKFMGTLQTFEYEYDKDYVYPNVTFQICGLNLYPSTSEDLIDDFVLVNENFVNNLGNHNCDNVKAYYKGKLLPDIVGAYFKVRADGENCKVQVDFKLDDWSDSLVQELDESGYIECAFRPWYEKLDEFKAENTEYDKIPE